MMGYQSLSENLEIELDKEDFVEKRNCSDVKSRPILIQFVRYDVRRAVYSNKRKLKGKFSDYRKPNSCTCQTIKTGSNKIWYA